MKRRAQGQERGRGPSLMRRTRLVISSANWPNQSGRAASARRYRGGALTRLRREIRVIVSQSRETVTDRSRLKSRDKGSPTPPHPSPPPTTPPPHPTTAPSVHADMYRYKNLTQVKTGEICVLGRKEKKKKKGGQDRKKITSQSEINGGVELRAEGCD